jgi:hypothetical protein
MVTIAAIVGGRFKDFENICVDLGIRVRSSLRLNKKGHALDYSVHRLFDDIVAGIAPRRGAIVGTGLDYLDALTVLSRTLPLRLSATTRAARDRRAELINVELLERLDRKRIDIYGFSGMYVT